MAAAAKKQQQHESNTDTTTQSLYHTLPEDGNDDGNNEDEQPTVEGINAMRLEAIKYQILTKLGLTAKPNISNDLPKRVVMDTLSRAEQSSAIVHQMVLDETTGGIHQHSQDMDGQGRFAMAMEDGSISNDTQNYVHQPARGDSYYMYSSGSSGSSSSSSGNSVGSGSADDASGSKNTQNGGPTDNRGGPSRWQNEQEQEEPHMQQHHDQPAEDDFFGQTREIITFAEKGKLYSGFMVFFFFLNSNVQ